jgi:hypothetical protein
MPDTPTDPPDHTPAELVAALIDARARGDDAAAAALVELAAAKPDDEGEEG